MKKLSLTKDKVALVDDEDYEFLSQYSWWFSGPGYAMTRIDGDIIYMHRLLTDAPEGLYVDHINRNKLDNRKSNLRLCSDRGNQGNKAPQKRGRSPYKGVFAISNTKGKPWRAQINQDGESVYLGSFHTQEEAAKAYNEAAEEYFGEFAWLNPV